MSKFLFGLSPTLTSQVRGKILGGDSILTLIATFSRVMHVSIRTNVSSASSMDQSTLYSGRGRGRDRGRERDFGGGRSSFGAGHNVSGGRLNASDKGPRHCTHCGRNNHISKKCWTKFGQPEWAQLADSKPHAPCDTPQTTSSTIPDSSTVKLSQRNMIDYVS